MRVWLEDGEIHVCSIPKTRVHQKAVRTVHPNPLVVQIVSHPAAGMPRVTRGKGGLILLAYQQSDPIVIGENPAFCFKR